MGEQVQKSDLVAGLQESRAFMARSFQAGARDDAEAIASMERTADRLICLIAAANRRAAAASQGRSGHGGRVA